MITHQFNFRNKGSDFDEKNEQIFFYHIDTDLPAAYLPPAC